MLAQLHEEEGIPWDGLIYLPSNPDILEGEGWDIYHATANYIMDQLVQQPVISNHHIDKAPRGWGIDFRTPIRPVDEPTILGGRSQVRSQVVIFYDQTILKPFSHQRCRYERWLVVGARVSICCEQNIVEERSAGQLFQSTSERLATIRREEARRPKCPGFTRPDIQNPSWLPFAKTSATTSRRLVNALNSTHQRRSHHHLIQWSHIFIRSPMGWKRLQAGKA